MPAVVPIIDQLSAIDTPWDPRQAATFNGQDIKVVYLQGDFIWHSHSDTDEVFLVQEGSMQMGVREAGVESALTLNKGDLYVVPMGQEHRPFNADARVLLFEKRGTVNTGDFEGEVPGHIHQTDGRSGSD
ncbi:hypothetical protein VHUM_03773 [Vanrija humicola]|uniref:Cupin type-2 domain-containing protein n=1 Tax=Vanrija humicola TaxID=5417 RepID=A0A7D8UZE0_VANHU|nr:hypothetical protein VHUM_03773 [Vanrija humicola]